MKLENRQVIEAVGIFTVVLSLIFVGLELQQSTIASKAASYQALGLAGAANWRVRAENRELNDILHEISDPANADISRLPASDINLARAFVISVLSTYETAYLQMESGLIDEDELSFLGFEGFLDSRLLGRLWPQVNYALTQEFLNYLDGRFELN